MKQLSALSAFLILFFCSIACWAEETPADNSDQAPTTEQTKSNDQSKDKQTDESEEEEEKNPIAINNPLSLRLQTHQRAAS